MLTNLDLSHNQIKCLPNQISMLSQLAVLNLNENKVMERLPVNLGLLEKLWSVQIGGCAFKEPLKSVVDGGNFKTMDLLAYLRNELDNSKPYNKLKLMLVGRSEVGKTALLMQLRQEGTVPKGSLQTDSWSARLGHQTKASSKSSSNLNAAQQKVSSVVSNKMFMNIF
jgi:Leucine-rich repeat (LRR) protein